MGQSVVAFRFPYDPDLNSALREAAGNRVRWDPQWRCFTLAVSRLLRDEQILLGTSKFVVDHGFDVAADARLFLDVDESVIPAPQTASALGRGSGTAVSRQLRADLLPASTWGSNLRGICSQAQWDALRIPVCRRACNRCEICGSASKDPQSGRFRRPDCHEKWVFERQEGRPVQRLERLMALCSDCHRVQHIGLARVRRELDLVVSQLRRVNNWTPIQAEADIARADRVALRREGIPWDLDLRVLTAQLELPEAPTLVVGAARRDELGNSYHITPDPIGRPQSRVRQLHARVSGAPEPVRLAGRRAESPWRWLRQVLSGE